MQKHNISINRAKTGANILNLMNDKHIEVKDMSKMMGISVQSIYKYIHGKSIPTIEHLYRLSRILEVKMDDIIVKERNTHI